jgi:hypothetical protein
MLRGDALEPCDVENGADLTNGHSLDMRLTACVSLVAFVADLVCLYSHASAVLELCGGEMKALSSIELQKRIDLQQ